MRSESWDAIPGLLKLLGWVKVVTLYFVLLGLGIAYIVMGHTAGRFIGGALVFVWIAISVGPARRFAKRFVKPS